MNVLFMIIDSPAACKFISVTNQPSFSSVTPYLKEKTDETYKE